jgi:hypothetical protein
LNGWCTSTVAPNNGWIDRALLWLSGRPIVRRRPWADESGAVRAAEKAARCRFIA